MKTKLSYTSLFVVCALLNSFSLSSEAFADSDFIRGEVNDDGRINITDARNIISYVSLGHPQPRCLDAADIDDNGIVYLDDGMHLVYWLFTGGNAPPPPSPSWPDALNPLDCGPDPSPDSLTCVQCDLCPGVTPSPLPADSRFHLAISAPRILSGEAGGTVRLATTVQLEAAVPGVQGWSFAISLNDPCSCRIIDASIQGTVADGVDFEHLEITSGPDGDGVICAAILSLENFQIPFELDPVSAPYDLLHLTLEAAVSEKTSKIATLQFIDDLQGSGQPVSNILAVGGESVLPVLEPTSFQVPTAAAASRYMIPWSTIDGGGGASSGGPYALTGTIGQPDADWSRGGDYELLGGFWPGGPLCIISFDDFARFGAHWLSSETGLDGDLNDDRSIDFRDLSLFAEFWLCYCPVDWPLKW